MLSSRRRLPRSSPAFADPLNLAGLQPAVLPQCSDRVEGPAVGERICCPVVWWGEVGGCGVGSGLNPLPPSLPYPPES